jgi:hypothetical protein
MMASRRVMSFCTRSPAASRSSSTSSADGKPAARVRITASNSPASIGPCGAGLFMSADGFTPCALASCSSSAACATGRRDETP